jgi:IMP dehydrogenase/GMP reductase
MYKNIEDVKSGDFIINKDGNPVKVLNSFCSGTKEVVKVRNNLFGQDTFVTPDHQFWIGDLNSTSKETISNVGYAKLLDKESKTVPRRSKYKWKSVGEMQQDVFLMPKNIKFEMPETFEIMLLKRTGGNWRSGPVYSDDVKIVPNYNSGYIFGTFLGDGNANVAVYKNSESGSVFWSFGLNEMYIAEKLSNALFNIFGKKPVIEKEDNIVLVKFHYKPLANFFNLFGKRDQKFLPQEYLVNNKEYLQGIFDGLVDSDGCYCKDGRTGFSNTSPQLIELFGVIAYILYGEFPNSEKPKITTGNLKGCNIENCKQSYFSRVLKNGKVRFTKDYQVVKFLEIEEIKKEVPVYDLEIDCDTHSFIANNMIVHNSLCSTRIETAAGVPQITALNNIYNMRNLCSRFEDKLIIADGGVKNSGDCVKGLCFADLVMAGNLFAGTEEAPGTKITKDGILYKEYAGSSTHKSSHIEGVTTFVPYKGTYQNVLTKLLEGIRSGCSYQGVDNLTDLKENPQFVKISSAGYRESIPHGVL